MHAPMHAFGAKMARALVKLQLCHVALKPNDNFSCQQTVAAAKISKLYKGALSWLVKPTMLPLQY